MGLDMYLHKKTYVKNWDHMSDEEKHQISIKKGGEIRANIKPERINEISEEVMYWRKANQVHSWFVENVQKGKDDCGDYYVEVEQLKTLCDLCQEVLKKTVLIEGQVYNGTQFKDGKETKIYEEGMVVANDNVAQELLPTASGFFFGGIEYDEYYIQDIRDTFNGLSELLKEDMSGGSLYYSSSW